MKGAGKRIVVALGGNALGNTPKKQLEQVKIAAEIMADLIHAGYELVIGHGNGPQVGIINSAMDYAAAAGPKTPYMPFAECGAMSQGFIGYHLQQALQQALMKRGLSKTVVSVVTQVEVDGDDPAFAHPSKPIGNFYSKEEAGRLAEEKGFVFIEDAGRGYRRVVPSPKPKRIIELSAIRKMVLSGLVVIAAGGGGIPVLEDETGFHGVDAVIDKDRTCCCLAAALKADIFLILTAVDQVWIHFNQPNQQPLSQLTTDQARQYMREGHFGTGSMYPKVEACVDFVKALPGRCAIITSLERARDALDGVTGTRIFSPEAGATEAEEEQDSLTVEI